MAAEMWAAIAAILGVGGNSAWGVKLQSQAGATAQRIDGIEKLADERHAQIDKRLERIEDGVDDIRRLLLEKR